MDAFAVAMCKGLESPKVQIKNAIIVGFYFGVFQAAMPLAGFFIGTKFAQYIEDVDHWIAVVLLTLIGLHMIIVAIKEKTSKKKEIIAKSANNHTSYDDIMGDVKKIEKSKKSGISFKVMFPLAIATSIDALITGMSFGFMNVSIYVSIAIIGGITFILSLVGVLIGNVLGSKLKSKAEIIGGIILIVIGLKVLFTHLGII